MFNWRNLKVGTKIGLVSVGGVLIMALALGGIASWQSGVFSQSAEAESDTLALNDLSDITLGAYHLVQAQDEAVQQQVNYNLNTAHYVLDNTGELALSSETITWNAVNQFTLQNMPVRLPRMLVGDEWLGQNTDMAVPTPVIDQIVALVGGTVTIFQRMNEQGDMLRVATNVEALDGRRAIGTFIPAINPDGRANAVVATVLGGETYRGSAYVVNDWYLTAYEPLYDADGQVMGMLYVGVKRENVQSLREAILNTQVGESGYVFVLGAQGDEQGVYLISEDGRLDGVSIWNTPNADGLYVAQDIVAAATALNPGELATVRYRWQNPDETEPHWRISRLTYYEPWGWIIGSTAYESELLAYRGILQGGRTNMLNTLAGAGALILLLVAGLSILLARSIATPINRLAAAARQIAAGDLAVEAPVQSEDEAGVLAQSFNRMTAQLRELIASLEDQVSERTRDLTQRSVYLAASTEVGRAVTQILDTELLLSQVVELIRESFGLYYVGLFLMDNAREWVVLQAGTGEAGRRMLARSHRIRVGEGMIGWSVANAQPRVALDVGVDAVRLASSELPNTRSEAALPLRSRGRVLGALTVQSDKPSAFDESAIAVLQVMADQVAVALDNAQLFSRAQDALESERRAYGDLTQRAWLAALRARADRGYRCDEEGVHSLVTAPALPAGPSLTGPVYEDAFTVALPLRIREQIVGMIRLRKPEAAGAWSDEELALMNSVIDQLSVALESARLYQDTQRRAQQERIVGEITGRMRESLELEAVLQTAVREMAQNLDIPEVELRVWGGEQDGES